MNCYAICHHFFFHWIFWVILKVICSAISTWAQMINNYSLNSVMFVLFQNSLYLKRYEWYTFRTYGAIWQLLLTSNRLMKINWIVKSYTKRINSVFSYKYRSYMNNCLIKSSFKIKSDMKMYFLKPKHKTGYMTSRHKKIPSTVYMWIYLYKFLH